MPVELRKESSADTLGKEVEAPYLVNARSSIFTKYVGKLEVKSRQQSRLSLGIFSDDDPAKGFSIEFSPEPESLESVVTQITTIGSPKHHELILQVANYGDKSVRGKVWQMEKH
jgi:hypothetical protein